MRLCAASYAALLNYLQAENIVASFRSAAVEPESACQLAVCSPNRCGESKSSANQGVVRLGALQARQLVGCVHGVA